MGDWGGGVGVEPGDSHHSDLGQYRQVVVCGWTKNRTTSSLARRLEIFETADDAG
ncbi:hypothetical protein V6000_001165 [Aspergillus fumigatus]